MAGGSFWPGSERPGQPAARLAVCVRMRTSVLWFIAGLTRGYVKLMSYYDDLDGRRLYEAFVPTLSRTNE